MWSLALPFAGVLVLALAWGRPLGLALMLTLGTALILSVLAAVHHAEVVAHKVGEPYGTLILAVAVTVIEASLIVSVMLSGGPTAAFVARDSVYAAVIIVCNGIIGLCLLVGGMRHHVISFRVDGTSPGLAVLATLSVVTLILPAYTTTTPGPTLTPLQLGFAGAISLILYGVFVFVQTVRHRDYFQVLNDGSASEEQHAPAPTLRTALISFGLLCVALVAVVGLAKLLAPAIEAAVEAAGLPTIVIGIAIAMLVLLPETGAAIRNAAANRMQTSLNLAIGSALACIGLTIPTVAVVSIAFDLPLELGIPPKDIVFLSLTLLVATLTLSSGRATVLQGAVHLVLFAAFLFLEVFP